MLSHLSANQNCTECLCWALPGKENLGRPSAFGCSGQVTWPSASKTSLSSMRGKKPCLTRLQMPSVTSFFLLPSAYKDRSLKLLSAYKDRFLKLLSAYKDRSLKLLSAYQDRSLKLFSAYKDRSLKIL